MEIFKSMTTVYEFMRPARRKRNPIYNEYYQNIPEVLKILSRANSLIVNNNIRSFILETKNDRCKIVKIVKINFTSVVFDFQCEASYIIIRNHTRGPFYIQNERNGTP